MTASSAQLMQTYDCQEEVSFPGERGPDHTRKGPRRRMENMLLLGESGMVKGMLLDKFERQNAAFFDKASRAQPWPVLVMFRASVPTESEFFECVLEVASTPWAGHTRNGAHLRAGVIRPLHELGMRVLVIDEVNSVLAGTPRQ